MYDPPLPRWREMATVFDVLVIGGRSLPVILRQILVLFSAPRTAGLSAMDRIARRDFLKAATAAGVGSAIANAANAEAAARAKARIASAAYTPQRDYPIRPQRAAAVRITDAFWGPKLR